MKPRPPTLRGKRRYLLASIAPWHLQTESKQVYIAIFDALSSLWGDALAAEIQMAVVACENGYVIIRCRRGLESKVETAIATVTAINGHNIALHSIATSGTIRSLHSRMKKLPDSIWNEEYEMMGQRYTSCRYSRQKVDLFVKGIKNQKTLYFTHNELEDY